MGSIVNGNEIYIYSRQIFNDYLGVSKIIKAQSSWELDLKIQEQERKWNEQESRQRERDRISDLKTQAEIMNLQAQKQAEEYSKILSDTLLKHDALDWKRMLKKRFFGAFKFNLPIPTLEDFFQKLNVPNKSFLEFIFKSIERKRLEKEAEAKMAYEKALEEYELSKKSAQAEHKKKKEKFEKEQTEYNDSILLWKEQFEKGDKAAIEKYIAVVLANSKYPEGICVENETSYDETTKTAVISMTIPAPEDINEVVGYKFVTSRKAIDPIIMKPKEKASVSLRLKFRV